MRKGFRKFLSRNSGTSVKTSDSASHSPKSGSSETPASRDVRPQSRLESSPLPTAEVFHNPDTISSTHTRTTDPHANSTTPATSVTGSSNPEGSNFHAPLYWSIHHLDLNPVISLHLAAPESLETVSPLPLEGHSLSPIPGMGGKFIIFGGFSRFHPDTTEGTYTNAVYWLSVTDMSLAIVHTTGDVPSKRAYHAAVAIGKVLVVWGGYARGQDDDDSLHFLDLNTWHWTQFRPMGAIPPHGHGFSLAAWRNSLFLYGGDAGDGSVDELWTFDLDSLRTPDPRWRRLMIPPSPHKPGPLKNHSCVTYSDSLYLFGGTSEKESQSGENYHNDVWKFDLINNTWTKPRCTGSIPLGRDCHAAAVVGNLMYVFGGRRAMGNAGDSIAFDMLESRWTQFATMGSAPTPRLNHAMAADGTKLILFGGGRRTAHELDPVVHVLHSGSFLPASDAAGPLSRLKFTQSSNPHFTEQAADLSAFIHKTANAAHALAGFSEVWKGQRSDTGQTVAIKVLRLSPSASPDEIEVTRKRFHREMYVWLGLKHPRVLEMLGFAFFDGIPCLVSPWCNNGNVMDYLKRNPRINRFALIMQVAEGLIYLHHRDPVVIHADIKAQNVVISDAGEAMLCDFGISKLIQDTPSGFTTTATPKGTARFMAKELLEGTTGSNIKSDVYAFGCLVLQIMTGKVPFTNLSLDFAVTLAVAQGKVPSPDFYPEIPASHPLWELLRSSWAPDPIVRPDMTEILDHLRALPPIER